MLLDNRADPDSRWTSRVALACVIFLCCAPLFIRLDGLQQRNDEAIYSYSVDRVLETGDWLTPRAIVTDTPFLEKPPLKAWMVAGLMKLGLLPQDDWGMRFLDAVLCSIAFIYVFLLGARIAGNFAVVSVFLLFSFEPLLFQHGIRGNNMEGALLLAYCGGMYHFVRWIEASGAAGRRQAWSCCAYFFLAFMTKFVAAFFLPVVCVVATALGPTAWGDWRSKWRDWVRPALVTAALIAPWFIYETIRTGGFFWEEILMKHIVRRFTGTLMPSHLHPWHHYFTALWDELQRAGSLPVFVLGLAALAWRAIAPGAPAARALARLLLVWWLLPEIVMSFGTSKLFYYSFPFLPPLAIGAGLALSQIFHLFTGAVRSLLARVRLAGFQEATFARWQQRRISYGLTVLGALCFILALSTAYAGSIDWQIHGTRLFKNSSIVKPIIVALVSWYFAGLGAGMIQVTGAVLLSFLLPLHGYAAQLTRLNEIDHPLREARDCALAIQDAKHLPRTGAYKMSGDTDHPYHYYLWRLGPFLLQESARGNELERRLEIEAERSLVILSAEDYVYLGGALQLPVPVRNPDTGIMPGVSDPARAAHLTNGLPPGVAISPDVVILFPAEYASCVRQVAHAGRHSKKLDAVSGR